MPQAAAWNTTLSWTENIRFYQQMVYIWFNLDLICLLINWFVVINDINGTRPPCPLIGEWLDSANDLYTFAVVKVIFLIFTRFA